jgi:ABC-type Na+ efflux pump permease subunit
LQQTRTSFLETYLPWYLEANASEVAPKVLEAPIEESAASKETGRSEEEHRSVSNDIEENLSSTWDIEMANTKDQQSESIFEETVGSDRVSVGCREAAKSFKKKIGLAVQIIKSVAKANEALEKEDPIIVAYLESVEVEEKSIEANVGIPSESAENDDVSPEIPAAGPSDNVDSKGLKPEVVHEVVEPFPMPAPFDVEEKSAEVSSEDIGEVHMVANLIVQFAYVR